MPLDFDGSLSYFRKALEKSSYNARALRHSRRLLVLYLGGQESGQHKSDVDLAFDHTVNPADK